MTTRRTADGSERSPYVDQTARDRQSVDPATWFRRPSRIDRSVGEDVRQIGSSDVAYTIEPSADVPPPCSIGGNRFDLSVHHRERGRGPTGCHTQGNAAAGHGPDAGEATADVGRPVASHCDGGDQTIGDVRYCRAGRSVTATASNDGPDDRPYS